ncbi:DNA sulfur modification protein DndD [Moritella sp. 36]|uniref:DNA sulfur modification protein DndD n=1 Tax=Moritella sp. 36 TaxID=2746233 RepID=UPI001BA5739C|nr:DNA sulfur modification protein DndD [Moritella sp. 36]QUM89940.1 DNA sulfur modification protein DndD [Moritella sp. 36]
MIIKQLTIENFGIYKGFHEIDLSVTKDKPIILFGGLNGGGKTTFLDALQLVLYGKHAKCSNRGTEAFSTYLANTKNRYAEESEHVELSITFRHSTDTNTKEFRVIRNWNVSGKSDTRDKVKVFCDGEEDRHLSQYWDEFVNEFIPLSLSDLFFFDGEKIENLAHPDRSSELIRTGIENLLGLDLLSQLQIDLGNVERKRKSANLDDSVMQKVISCEADIGDQDIVVHDLRTDLANLDKQASEYNLSINKSRQKVRNAGAHLIEERDSIKFELGAIEQKLRANQQGRVKLDAGCGPLALVSNLINQTKQQINLEQQATQAKVIEGAICAYEQTIKASLTEAGVNKQALSKVAETMLELANERQKVVSTECYINSNVAIFNGLNEKLATDSIERKQFAEERTLLLEAQALFDKKLESVPDYETVQHLLNELAECEVMFKNTQTVKKQKLVLLEQAAARLDVLNQRYSNLLTQQSKDTFEQKRAGQVAEHIGKLKSTMQSFAEKLVAENVDYLQSHISKKFHDLSRKEKLINGILICPTSFELTLQDNNNQTMSPSRLSAGERQLLAIAVLWGLAEASGKEIPTVIDTPLGRLDGEHRNKLINNYFPNASQQVILLSTDEEINGQYYEQLNPAICREYHIQYNELEQSSAFTEGYF